MSATAVVPAPRIRNELAAGWRHFVTAVRVAARDPFALGLLAVAGAVTVPLWGYGLGIHPLDARNLPWPRGGWLMSGGAPPSAAHLAIRLPHWQIVFAQLLGAALVAGAFRPTSARRWWLAATDRGTLPLPLGPRARVVAEVFAVSLYALIARLVVLGFGGVRLGRTLFGHDPRFATYPEVARLLPSLASPTAAYASSFVVNTVLGVLLSFPLVLAWATTTRLDPRGLVKTAIATLLLFGAASVGAMAHVGPALLVSASATAFLLVRLDDASRAESARPARSLRFRPSPGPRAQLRRDACVGPARSLGLALLLGGGLPLALALVHGVGGLSQPFSGMTVSLRSLAGATVFSLWATLLAVAFFPFGLPLAPAATSARGPFAGAFMRSWATLPVSRERVARLTYAHGLIAAAFAWLVLCAQVSLLAGRLRPVLYEVPAVFLVPGIVVCEAVGDRRRGLWAVGALAAFQFGLPVVFALLPEVLGSAAPFERNGVALGIAGYLVGLAGAVPPVVHLRGRAPSLPS